MEVVQDGGKDRAIPSEKGEDRAAEIAEEREGEGGALLALGGRGGGREGGE